MQEASYLTSQHPASAKNNRQDKANVILVSKKKKSTAAKYEKIKLAGNLLRATQSNNENVRNVAPKFKLMLLKLQAQLKNAKKQNLNLPRQA